MLKLECKRKKKSKWMLFMCFKIFWLILKLLILQYSLFYFQLALTRVTGRIIQLTDSFIAHQFCLLLRHDQA